MVSRTTVDDLKPVTRVKGRKGDKWVHVIPVPLELQHCTCTHMLALENS